MIVINDKVQANVVPCIRRDGSSDYKCFIAKLLLSFLSKNFKNWSTFGKVMDKSIVAPFSVHGVCVKGDMQWFFTKLMKKLYNKF